MCFLSSSEHNLARRKSRLALKCFLRRTLPLIVVNLSISFQSLLVNGHLENVDLGSGKVSRADTSFEQKIQFSKGSTSWLWDAEICVDDAHETNSALLFWLRSRKFVRTLRSLTQKNPVKLPQSHSPGLIVGMLGMSNRRS